jgi:hypothetical protein
MMASAHQALKAGSNEGASNILRSIKRLHGCTVATLDGDIRSVDAVYFDDEAFGVRYLVVET